MFASPTARASGIAVTALSLTALAVTAPVTLVNNLAIADARKPVIALETGNSGVYVAWLGNAGSIKVFVKRWDGKMWQPLGGFLNVDPKSYVESSSLALASSGRPMVAWSEEVTRTQRRVYVKRWNGQMWTGL